MNAVQREMVHLARRAAIGILQDLESLEDPSGSKDIQTNTRSRIKIIRTAMKGLKK